MPHRIYPLPSHQGGNLVVSWQRGWRLGTIRQNGKLIGMIPNFKLLSQKQKIFYLSDGSELRITGFYTGSIFYDFSLYLEGELLFPINDISRWLTLSSGTLFLIAGLNLLAGLFHGTDQLDSWSILLAFLVYAGVSPLALIWQPAAFIFSGLYLFLGVQVRRCSWLASMAALGLVFLDSIYPMFALFAQGGGVGVLVKPLLFFRLGILFVLATAFTKLNVLQIEPLIPNLGGLHKATNQVIGNVLAFVIDPIGWILSNFRS